MNPTTIRTAALALLEAHRSGTLLASLPEAGRPKSIAEGHAIQDDLLDLLGEPVAGYKTSGITPGEVMRGAVLRSRFFTSPAEIPVANVPLLGIESEIAFRLDRDLPARDTDYTAEEVADAVTALPAIEVVSSRFADYHGTPVLHRLSDSMSNGALVCGEPRTDWRRFDFTKIAVSLLMDGKSLAETVGGHSLGDPLLPLVALANEMRASRGLHAGQVVMTGTFTGLLFAKPGATITARFEGFGTAELRFVA